MCLLAQGTQDGRCCLSMLHLPYHLVHIGSVLAPSRRGIRSCMLYHSQLLTANKLCRTPPWEQPFTPKRHKSTVFTRACMQARAPIYSHTAAPPILPGTGACLQQWQRQSGAGRRGRGWPGCACCSPWSLYVWKVYS